MNRNDSFETFIHHVVITLALIAFGYWLAKATCPKTAAEQRAPNEIDARDLKAG
jgi:hypothetical protein